MTPCEIANSAAHAIAVLNDLTHGDGELSNPNDVRAIVRSLELIGQGLPQLYEQLARFLPTPVVVLNHAVAVGMAFGPSAALPLVAALEESGQLAGYHLLPATRADMLRRLGRLSEASLAYREALELAGTDAERRFLTRRLAETSI